MLDKNILTTSDFWTPEFEYEHREDGAIIMQQAGTLPAHMPTLADYLDKWAEATPEATWLARRGADGDWQRINYGAAQTQAAAIGAALLGLGLGPERPLLILSENSLEHGLIALACLYVGIPYAPVSPAYALVSQDHAKLKGITETLNPGALFADDGESFAMACAAIAADDRHVINLRKPLRAKRSPARRSRNISLPPAPPARPKR